MAEQYSPVVRARTESILATNSVIRNTYILLSMSLLFSAAMAGVAIIINAPPMGLLTLIGYFGLFFLCNALRNSVWGIAAVFALTGFMGYTLGPILNFYITHLANGSQIVMTALGGTGAIFLGLSAYALTTRKDFSYLTGFLMSASMVLFVAIIISIFFPLPLFQLIISSAFMLFASAMILFETSNIIHGGETNYILATISLYVSIYNLFISLLHILTAFSGRE
ncbi:MAG TPA: Bax inhibitor-1/YccA family protein [Gammaproteobacteria bacterium]|nr:Bax inhibitor-1/YccA family protein [Gammaproteobacteria bacterium]